MCGVSSSMRHMLGPACDISEYWRQAHDPAVEYRQISEAHDLLPAPPLFMFGAVTASVLNDIFGGLRLGDVGCYIIKDAIIAPDGVAIRGGIPLGLEAFNQPLHHVNTIAAQVNRMDMPVRDVAGPACVIYGGGLPVYGHWLVDFLPRLWVLDRAGYDLGTTTFLMPDDAVPFVWEIMRLLGIKDSQIVRYNNWVDLVRTDQLVMPTTLRTENRVSLLFREATRFWIRRILSRSHLPPSQFGERIFVSRAMVNQERRLLNRQTIESMAMDCGFQIVFPEQLDFLSQVATFRAARQIIGEYGSGLHGSIFSRRDTLSCAIRGNQSHPGYMQSGLGQALLQQTGYVFGDCNEALDQQSFSVDEAAFVSALSSMNVFARPLQTEMCWPD